MDQSIFSRARARLVGAPIGFTLTVILLLGLIPAGLMGYYFVNSGVANIEIVERELEGVEMLRHIQPVDAFVANPPKDKEAYRREATRSASILQSAMKHGGHAQSLNSKKHFDAVLGKLRMGIDGFETNPRPAFDALVTRIGDQSGLILDPELESYYLMDIILLKSRRLARAAQELAAVDALSGNARDQMLLISRHRVGDAARDLQAAAVSAINGNRDGTLERSNLLDTINATIAASNDLVSDGDVAAKHKKLIAANEKSWNAAAAALDRALLARKDRINAEMNTGLGISGGVVLVVLLMAGLVIFALTDGLRKISQRLDLLSVGDYYSPVPGTEYRNDIGVIASALQHFVDMNGEVDAERARAKAELEETVERVRKENEELLSQALRQQAQAQEVERAAVAKLSVQLESQMSELLAGSRTAAHQMDREASSMAESASGVQREASAAAVAANEIRRSVAEVVPEVQAVAAQLQSYTRSLSDAKSIASDAVTRVDIAKQRIADFDSATSRAAAMLDLITKVAHKTNMLALNASIEAMRVGEAGQGFMVVAEEVKALARSTRDAANEIGQQIHAMEGANSAVASAFGEVLDVVNVLASQSDSIATGMDVQAAAIAQVNEAIGSASGELSTMAASMDNADRSASAAIERSKEMLAASRSVSATVGTLDQSVREFLGSIQSAQQQRAA